MVALSTFRFYLNIARAEYVFSAVVIAIVILCEEGELFDVF